MRSSLRISYIFLVLLISTFCWNIAISQPTAGASTQATYQPDEAVTRLRHLRKAREFMTLAQREDAVVQNLQRQLEEGKKRGYAIKVIDPGTEEVMDLDFGARRDQSIAYMQRAIDRFVARKDAQKNKCLEILNKYSVSPSVLDQAIDTSWEECGGAEWRKMNESLEISIGSVGSSDDSEYKTTIKMAFSLKNTGNTAIVGGKVNVYFWNLFGEEMLKCSLAFDDTIRPGGEVSVSYRVEVRDPTVELRNLPSSNLEKLTIQWEPTLMVYEDGSRLSTPVREHKLVGKVESAARSVF